MYLVFSYKYWIHEPLPKQVIHFNWNETDRALKLYGMNNLYAKDPRDACLIVAINNRIFDPEKIDKLLVKEGLKKLSKDE